MKDTIDRSGGFYRSRRTLGRLLGFAAVAIPLGLSRGSWGANTSDGQIAADRSLFMRAANNMREQALQAGEQAYGAIIVKGTEIVGRGPSGVVTKGDPTAHAEIEAIVGDLAPTTLPAARCMAHQRRARCVRRRRTGPTWMKCVSELTVALVARHAMPDADQGMSALRN